LQCLLRWHLLYGSTRLINQTKLCASKFCSLSQTTCPYLSSFFSGAFFLDSFDEVHFGKFASYYILGEYYFDVHPPFAKLLFGLAGWFSGFDGQFHFDNIGDSYTTHHVPYVGMRALPAILGSLTVPVVYAIMKQSGYSTVIAAFSAAIILFGMLRCCAGYLSLELAKR